MPKEKNINYEPPNFEEEDRQKLIEFLIDLKEILEDVVNNPRPIVPGRHHKALSRAWKSIQKEFDESQSTIKSNNLDQELAKNGLSGDGLNFKIGIFNHARDEYYDHGNAKEGQSKDRKWWRFWRPLFGRVMKAGDIILGSIAIAISVAEPIKEFKEAVEVSLELTKEIQD